MSRILGRWLVPLSVIVGGLCLALPFLITFISSPDDIPARMPPIRTVAVAGGSGTLGSRIIEQLLAAGFTVTALTRASATTTPTFPPGVTVAPVDYSSSASLAAALAGQDAVVSALATAVIGVQKGLVDAAVEAGVRRFVPSEFGIDTRKARGSVIGGILKGKVELVDYLEEISQDNKNFTWTGLSVGLFFDWGLDVGSLGFDLKTRTASIYDSGDEPSQVSNLPFIGRAVAALLSRPDETANQYLRISSFTPSQNEILRIIEEEDGQKWTVKKISTVDAQRLGEEKLQKGDYSAFGDLLKRVQFADGVGNAPLEQASANGLLGLKNEDVRVTVRGWLRDRGA